LRGEGAGATFSPHAGRRDYSSAMQLAKDSCACGHPLDSHDGGRGGPCNHCACAAGEAPSAFQVGVIHSMHEMTVMLARLVKEIQGKSGGQA
jgi:hypothetical protein